MPDPKRPIDQAARLYGSEDILRKMEELSGSVGVVNDATAGRNQYPVTD